MQISAQDLRTQAEAAATAWWVGKPFPEASWGRPYLCDVCGTPITDREGTALVESRLECAACTDRTFPMTMHQPSSATFGPEPPQQFGPYPLAAPPPVFPPAAPSSWEPATAPQETASPPMEAPPAPVEPPPAAWAPPAGPPSASPPPTAWTPPVAPPPTMPIPMEGGPPPAAPPARPRGRNRRKWTLIALAVVAVAGLVIGLLVWAPWVKHPPNVPANVRGTSATATSVTVEWDAPEGGTKPEEYVISRDGTEVATVPASATSFKDDDLDPGKSYSYTVRATAGSLESDWSQSASAKTLAPSPERITAGATTTTTAWIKWSAPDNAPDPDEYVILRDGSSVGTVSGSTTSFKDTGLTPATTYSYRVSATYSETSSPPTTTLSVRTATPTLSAARLDGYYDMEFRVTSSGGGSLRPGMTWDDGWTFDAKCASGPCSVTLRGDIAPGGYTSHSFTLTLNRAGSLYTGSTQTHISHCGNEPLVVDVQNTVSVNLRVTAGAMNSGDWTASRMSGSVTMSAPYTSAGSYYCPAQSHSMAVTGS